jgi:hypothetical protein
MHQKNGAFDVGCGNGLRSIAGGVIVGAEFVRRVE